MQNPLYLLTHGIFTTAYEASVISFSNLQIMRAEAQKIKWAAHGEWPSEPEPRARVVPTRAQGPCQLCSKTRENATSDQETLI